MRNSNKVEFAPVRSQIGEDTESGGRAVQGNAEGKRKSVAKEEEEVHGRGGSTGQKGRGENRGREGGKFEGGKGRKSGEKMRRGEGGGGTQHGVAFSFSGFSLGVESALERRSKGAGSYSRRGVRR